MLLQRASSRVTILEGHKQIVEETQVGHVVLIFVWGVGGEGGRQEECAVPCVHAR